MSEQETLLYLEVMMMMTLYKVDFKQIRTKFRLDRQFLIDVLN
jgi:hypothetical protein